MGNFKKILIVILITLPFLVKGQQAMFFGLNKQQGFAAWDLSTAQYKDSKQIFTSKVTDGGLCIGNSDMSLYVGMGMLDSIYQYSFGTKGDVSTLTLSKRLYVGAAGDSCTGISFKPDGTMMFVSFRDGSCEIATYTLSTAWDISTATLTRCGDANYSGEDNLTGILFGNSGSNFYLTDKILTYIRSYSMSTAYNTTTRTLSYYYDLGGTYYDVLTDIKANNDGSKFYLCGYTNTGGTLAVSEYYAPASWQLYPALTLLSRKEFYAPTWLDYPISIAWSSDGLDLYISCWYGKLLHFVNY